MEIAAIENDAQLRRNTSKHNWIQLLYMITSAICFVVEVYQRILVNLHYTHTNIHVPSLNRYPTDFTASWKSISYIWYLVFIWQALWMIYGFIGIFRRTPSGSYFYAHPCAMNETAFFYTALAHLLYIPILLSAIDNTYYPQISALRYTSTFVVVISVFIAVHTTLQKNIRSYWRNRYFLDVCLARLFYQNGLALWAAILFYESCLSIILNLIYHYEISSSIAWITGSCIFLIGLTVSFIQETRQHKDPLRFVLAHWLVFYWLLFDIHYISRNRSSISLFTVTFVPLIHYIVLCFIFWRLMLLYLHFREKGFPTFRSGKVYNLIDPPPTAF